MRDVREVRTEDFPSAYMSNSSGMRRPASTIVHEARSAPATVQADSFRAVQAESGGADRGMHHAAYASPRPHDPNMHHAAARPYTTQASQEPASAYFSMDLQLVTATRAFSDTLVSSGARQPPFSRLLDIIAPQDRDRAYRLQRTLEDERQERKTSYLPPIIDRNEEQRVIEAVRHEELTYLTREFTSRTEILTLLTFEGHQKMFDVNISLAKKDSTYFVVLVLVGPITAPSYRRATPPYLRDAQHGAQAPYSGQPQAHQYPHHQQPPVPLPRDSMPAYAPPPVVPPAQHAQQQPRAGFMYVPSGGAPFQPHPTSSRSAPPIAPSYTQHPSPPRALFGQPYRLEQRTPRSEPLRQTHELQLPPIRTPSESGSSAYGPTPTNERIAPARSGRVDINGLLQDAPDAPRRY